MTTPAARGAPEREPARWIVVALLAIVDLATVVVLMTTRAEPLVRVGLLVLAFGALGSIAALPELRRALTTRAVVVASLALMAASVALPSQQSKDLWSYAMQGRMVAHYGTNPYTHSPDHYPADPLYSLVGAGWRGTESVYGPAFTGVSATIMAVTGTARLPTRLAFQLLAAVAVLAAMMLVARRTRDPVALLLIGVNPLIAIEVVNTGRNDALVGLAILGGVLLAGRRRLAAAAAVVALAALVKVVALAALGGVLIWAVRHCGIRTALRATAVGAAVFVVPYAFVGGTRALRPLADASDRISRATIWQLARTDSIAHLFGTGPAEPIRQAVDVVGPWALLLIAGLGLLFVLSRLADPTPELVAAAAVVAFLLASNYVLASYVAWVLPVLAWRHRAGMSRLVLGWSGLVVIAYQVNDPIPPRGDDVLPWLLAGVTALVAAGAIVVLVVAAARRLGQGVRPARPASRSIIGASSDTATAGPKIPVARMSSVSMPRAI